MQTYLDLLRDVVENGEGHDDRTGVGTRSVFGRQWRHDMASGFPLLTTKKVPLRWVFEELRWFLSGSTNAAFLRETGVNIWDEWATKEQCNKFNRLQDDLGPIYGHQWRRFGESYEGFDEPGCNGCEGVDQIARLLNDIEESPNSRRLIVSGWHPYQQSQVALPPCHTLWQVKCHKDGQMSLQLYARSIDIFLGLPFNIASYALLLEMLCGVTNRTPKDLVISFGDLHLYNNHVNQAEIQLNREPHPLPMVFVGRPKGDTPLEKLLAIQWENVALTCYAHHPKIEADVAI